MDNIAKVLNDYLKSAKTNSLNFDVANFMLKNINTLSEMRVADVAEQCHVSTPSVIRFCRTIGFEDYKDLRNSLRLQREIIKANAINVENINIVV